MSHAVEDVTFVTVALETSGWVHAGVVAGPVERALVDIYKNREREKHFIQLFT